eukprot:231014_1
MARLLRKIRRVGGLLHFIDLTLRNNGKPFWDFLQKKGTFRQRQLNSIYTVLLLRRYNKTAPRVNKYTLKQDYASYESMYDESRTVYARLLPPNPEYAKRLNEKDPGSVKAAECFYRNHFKAEPHQNLSLLIGYYAQWFSHQFFNTNPEFPKLDENKNVIQGEYDYSNIYYTNQPVGINLSQLYGSIYKVDLEHKERNIGSVYEYKLRKLQDGLLKESYIPDIGINNNDKKLYNVYPEIVTSAEYQTNLTQFPYWDAERGQGQKAFVMPVALANMVPGFAAIHVLFFRHHQYITMQLKQSNPDWDDDRLFQISKIVNMLTCVKITMNDYVGRALQTSLVKLDFDTNFKDSIWYKLFAPTNFESINAIQWEFNILYRWHQFYPDNVRILKSLNGDINNYNDVNILEFPQQGYHLNGWNAVDYFEGNIHGWTTDKESAHNYSQDSLERLLYSAAKTPAGMVTLLNTPTFLAEHVVKAGLDKTRRHNLASYNDYRQYFGFPPARTWNDITEDPEIINALKTAYDTVDDIEYYTGIFAEDKDFNAIHGPFLLSNGIGLTYTGIFASRLWNTEIVNEKLLSNKGMELLGEVERLRDLTRLHTKLGETELWKELTFKMGDT